MPTSLREGRGKCTFLVATVEHRGGNGGVDLLGLMRSEYLPVMGPGVVGGTMDCIITHVTMVTSSHCKLAERTVLKPLHQKVE